jgi:hypothetical protein
MTEKLVSIACVTGFVGDASLQILTKYLGMGSSTGGWGLKKYFKQHGSPEALFIAGGMMTIFYVIYIYFLRLPLTWYYLALYGIILDYIFRKLEIFPSLDGYYKALNYFWSAFWGAVPLLLPFLINKYFF